VQENIDYLLAVLTGFLTIIKPPNSKILEPLWQSKEATIKNEEFRSFF
jgi:hypothetical protein